MNKGVERVKRDADLQAISFDKAGATHSDRERQREQATVTDSEPQ